MQGIGLAFHIRSSPAALGTAASLPPKGGASVKP